ncbi:hypothetical protein DWB84_18460 [Saccharophagus sp. K07]|uniref:hypothetical protein n=1 Tax=Saccharophagus sp. K07 TaxID=2283636 RepID=UPI001651B47E|nr:hypothetical protein [Saccharophagus sp. K07]MBC6907422.1 hypothetical protein [Saccharophagus sp. K07]
MGTVQRPNRLILLVILGLSAVLAACSSGGGKGGSSQNNRDTIPDSFTLTTPSGVDPTKVGFGTAVVSAPVKITGINAPAPVSIQGGEFKIDNGAFSSSAGTISNGQSIQVRVQTPIKAEQTATAILTIGGVEASFTVTTGPDTTPPEVSILFPPPASMTEGQTLFVRGTVKDVHGALEDGAITVNGVEAELELNETKDEGTWSVTVDLQPGENIVEVTAIDVAKNANEEDKPSVRSRRVESIVGESFPDNENPFGKSIKADISWENANPVAYVADSTALKVFKVDLNTGNRTILADNEGFSEELKFQEPWGIHLGSNNKLYVSDITRRAVFEIDLKDGTRSIISSISGTWLTGLLLRLENNKEVLYIGELQGKIFRIDLEDKEQTLLIDSRLGLNPGGEQYPSVFDLEYSANEDGIFVSCRNGIYLIRQDEQVAYFDAPSQAITSVVSSVSDGLYYVNSYEYLVYYLDGPNGQAIPVSNIEAENRPLEIWGIAGDKNLGYLLIIDMQNGLIAMDHKSFSRVIISKSVN